jgi:DNA replication protein DnaD
VNRLSAWKIDPTISISAILACAAIISPILTALINNAHHRKMRLLELKQEKYKETVVYQRKAIENYIQNTSVKIQVRNLDSNIDYASCFGLAALYVPEKQRGLMIEINDLLIQQNREAANERFKLLLPELISILQKL